MVAQQLSQKGPGEIIIPNLLKLSIVIEPVTHQYEGINPFIKEPVTFKAKQARKSSVRVRPLKAFKDAI